MLTDIMLMTAPDTFLRFGWNWTSWASSEDRWHDHQTTHWHGYMNKLGIKWGRMTWPPNYTLTWIHILWNSIASNFFTELIRWRMGEGVLYNIIFTELPSKRVSCNFTAFHNDDMTTYTNVVSACFQYRTIKTFRAVPTSLQKVFRWTMT